MYIILTRAWCSLLQPPLRSSTPSTRKLVLLSRPSTFQKRQQRTYILDSSYLCQQVRAQWRYPLTYRMPWNGQFCRCRRRRPTESRSPSTRTRTRRSHWTTLHKSLRPVACRMSHRAMTHRKSLRPMALRMSHQPITRGMLHRLMPQSIIKLVTPPQTRITASFTPVSRITHSQRPQLTVHHHFVCLLDNLALLKHIPRLYRHKIKSHTTPPTTKTTLRQARAAVAVRARPGRRLRRRAPCRTGGTHAGGTPEIRRPLENANSRSA